ncbi:MAG: DUF5681 domain-containing protein [Treponema sp.]|jgi:hypothetical protein|nr:DUF5681 domain-containing protein [Treponema sp.]
MAGRGFQLNPQYINRKGRPKKGATLTDILNKELGVKSVRLECDGKDQLITKKEAIALKIIELAINGDLPAIKYIFDRIDGMLTQHIGMDATIVDTTETELKIKDALNEIRERKKAEKE